HSKHMSASNCKKNIDILDQADVFGIISNLLLPDFKVISQSSGILPLSKIINKNICLNFTTYRIEDITTQQLKSTLNYIKYYEDFSLYSSP
ncbi:1099_t:CDS:1, partial [Funneliformis geosporum]